MQQLGFPHYYFHQKKRGNKQYIYDEIRKKYVFLSPEEWVRQHIIKYLIIEKDYPGGLIAVEVNIQLNNLTKRADIVAYNKRGQPHLIVECKSPRVNISQRTLEQVVRYNMKLHVNYLILTNGLVHYCCKIDYTNNKYEFLESIPFYQDIILPG